MCEKSVGAEKFITIVSDLKTIEYCHKKYNAMMICIKYNNGLKKTGICKNKINLWSSCVAKLMKD